MPDDGAWERMFRLELGRLHEGVVRAPRPLQELLREERPAAPAAGGAAHDFDVDALRRLAAALSPLARARLRLPILAYLDAEAAGSAFVSDPGGQRALAELGEARSQPREGKLWVSEALLRDFAQRFPSCVQFVLR